MITVGSALAVITNELGTDIQGAGVGGKAEYVRDELEASVICMKHEDEEVMFVSCDLGGLESDFTRTARDSMAAVSGVDPRSIIIGGTHTGGPSILPSNYEKPVDLKYLEKLKKILTELAERSINSMVPARIGIGKGHAAIGYNRRTCWNDGSHKMGRDSNEEGSFTGVEGPNDNDQFVLYAVDEDDKVLAVLHQNTSHPCTFFGADFYSADYPGLARKYIREALGEIPVLFFNGAFGDIGQDMFSAETFGESREMKIRRCAFPLAGETLRLIYENPPMKNNELKHIYKDLDVKVRLPSTEKLKWAEGVLEKIDAGEPVSFFDKIFSHGAVLLQKRFGNNPVDLLPIHIIRIGPAAIVTQPTELFCYFGLEIKRRSPFALTAVFSICDGYAGYCPTYDAIIAGGYSGDPIYWTRFSPETGYNIADEACSLLFSLNRES